MRRKREPLIKRTVSGSLAALMTAISVLSTSGALPAFASESNVKLSYQKEEIEKIGLYVQAENESFAPGGEVNLTIYIQNNSDQPLTEGTLKWVDKKETLQNAAFVYETEDREAEEKATPDSAQEETAETEETEVPEETDTPQQSNAAEAEPESKAAGPASDFGQDDGITVEEDWFEDEDEDSADDAEQSGPYLDEDGYVRNISLAPGEIFQIPFTAIVNEDIFGIRTRDIRFTFGARTPDNKRLSNYVKYQFNTGLMTMQPIELVGGNQVETNEENTMIFRLDMDDIEYMFEDDGSASKASDSNAIASDSEAEAEFTPAEVIDSETEKATPSEAEKATASEAEKETPEAEEAASEAEKATASEAKQEEEKAEEENEGIFRPEEVKYSIETYGVRLKGVKARFDEEASGPAESVTEVSYRVASDTKPGFYFGKVTASVRYNGNTYKTEQGFVMNVTGEGQMVLRGKLGDAEIEVRGPAESFPDGEILSLRVTELSEEQKEMVQQAMEKMAQEKGIAVGRMKAMDIKVITDGTPQEINGPVEVTFVNVNLEDINKTEEKEDTLKEKLAELFSEEEEKKTELENAEVWHLNEDEITLDKMDSTVDEDGNVVMKTNHFSSFVLTDPGRILYTAAPRDDDLTVVTKAESGITFKLFDYSSRINVLSKTDDDDKDFRPITPYFNFRNSGSSAPLYPCNETYDQDGFTKNHATVERILRESDGVKYPVLDLTRDARGDQRGDPGLSENQRSLDYLFGAKEDFAVTSYEAENTILVKEGNKYSYNSQENAVDYDKDNKLFRVRNYSERNDSTAGYGEAFGDFLPFNYTGGEAIGTSGSGNEYHVAQNDPIVPTNYWFGMTMEVPFFQTKDGKIATGNDTQEEMVFRFSGDDDVWVFIDDVLVLDLGGTHGTVDGSINFATGEVLQYLTWNGANSTLKEKENGSATSFPTTIRDCFDAAKKEPNGGWADNNSQIFAEYTKHTLKFFYMERGAAVANCKLEFNLPTLPDKSLKITKVLEGPKEVTDYLKQQMEYKFRVWQMGNDGRPTDKLFIKQGDTYTFTPASGPERKETITEEDGSFSLKAGESALFTEMLKKGQEDGIRNYYVEEILPDNLSGQYSDVLYTVSGNGGEIKTEEAPSGRFTSYKTGSLYAGEAQSVLFRNKVDTKQLVKVKVTKVWEDSNDSSKNRPDNVKFRLYYREKAEAGDVEEQWEVYPYAGEDGIITLTNKNAVLSDTSGSTWEGTLTNLPQKSVNGKLFEYTIKEVYEKDGTITELEDGAGQGTTPGLPGKISGREYEYGVKYEDVLTDAEKSDNFVVHKQITNFMKAANLKLRKTVENPNNLAGEPIDKNYKFLIKLVDNSTNLEYTAVALSDGETSGNINIRDFDEGGTRTFTITEIVPMEYELTKSQVLTEGMQERLVGSVITVKPGDDLLVELTNTPSHSGYFHHTSSVTNQKNLSTETDFTVVEGTDYTEPHGPEPVTGSTDIPKNMFITTPAGQTSEEKREKGEGLDG